MTVYQKLTAARWAFKQSRHGRFAHINCLYTAYSPVSLVSLLLAGFQPLRPYPFRVWIVKAKAVLSLGHHAVISWSLETDCWDNRIIHLSQLIVACNQIWLLSSSIRETVRSSVKAKLKLRWNVSFGQACQLSSYSENVPVSREKIKVHW